MFAHVEIRREETKAKVVITPPPPTPIHNQVRSKVDEIYRQVVTASDCQCRLRPTKQCTLKNPKIPLVTKVNIDLYPSATWWRLFPALGARWSAPAPRGRPGGTRGSSRTSCRPGSLPPPALVLVWVLRIRDPVPFWLPGSGMGEKIRIRDKQPGSYFRELKKLRYFLG